VAASAIDFRLGFAAGLFPDSMSVDPTGKFVPPTRSLPMPLRRGNASACGPYPLASSGTGVQRIRPKIMTVCAIIFGLLPINWSPAYQTGADVMKRIATPMIGGVITSAVFNLLIYPVIYVIWRKRSLPAVSASGLPVSPGIPESRAIARTSRREVLAASIAIHSCVVSGAYRWHECVLVIRFWQFHHAPGQPRDVAKITQDGVTASILSPDGQIHAKDDSLQIRFQDQGGHPVDAENVKLELNMNRPGMVMHSEAKIKKKDDKIGDYQVHLTPDMAGDWSLIFLIRGSKDPRS
jgi:hypothetical protein